MSQNHHVSYKSEGHGTRLFDKSEVLQKAEHESLRPILGGFRFQN